MSTCFLFSAHYSIVLTQLTTVSSFIVTEPLPGCCLAMAYDAPAVYTSLCPGSGALRAGCDFGGVQFCC